MSAKIAATLDVHFTRRMRNWARAWPPNEAQGYAFTGAYADRVGGAYESREPILGGEARDTDRALLTLPLRERAAVGLYWLREGHSLRWIGRELGVHRETAELRICQGHRYLRLEFRRQRARAELVILQNRRLTNARTANNLANVVSLELRPEIPR